jgi:hypothetical protein
MHPFFLAVASRPPAVVLDDDIKLSYIRPPANGVKRQANINIEVPPLPVDWWAWEEIHSPLMDDGPNSSPAFRKAVGCKVQKHQSKKQPNKQVKKQPKKQPQKRPRGRPRRARHSPITNDDHLNQTRPRQPTSPDHSERREREKSVSAADERPLRTRKQKTSSRGNILDQNPVECVSSSNGPEHS